ncbi:MAG: transposase [Phycisphaerales bacterium]
MSLAFEIWAFVLMPEHAHLVVHPVEPSYSIGAFLAAVKRPVAGAARRHLESTGRDDWLDRLTTSGRFRFWQPGGGHDRNIWSPRVLWNAIEYIHANPVRRGLVGRVTDWRWSSARFWLLGDADPMRMDPIRI